MGDNRPVELYTDNPESICCSATHELWQTQLSFSTSNRLSNRQHWVCPTNTLHGKNGFSSSQLNSSRSLSDAVKMEKTVLCKPSACSKTLLATADPFAGDDVLMTGNHYHTG